MSKRPEVYCNIQYNLLQKLMFTGPACDYQIFNEPFGTTKAVKQSCVLSPILFILSLDDLIQELKDNVGGCRIGMKYFGIAGLQIT